MSKAKRFEEAWAGIAPGVRTHISATRIKELRDTTSECSESCKPVGLWYGLGDSWAEWVKYEMPTRAQGYLYKLHVDMSKILVIRSVEELMDFTKEFGASIDTQNPLWALRNDMIDWPSVASQWNGIEIAPYQYTCRLSSETGWYYGWDVASGCIWNPYSVEYEKVCNLKGVGSPEQDAYNWRELYEQNA
jgi:hypothetical protein